MLCLRCIRSLCATSSRSITSRLPGTLQPSFASRRSLSVLSNLSSRPTLQSQPQTVLSKAATAFAEDTPTSSLTPLQTSLPQVQVRGAIRDTFSPSHRVRKRRHGFLARLKSRTGRKILKRRRLKGRNTLSH